MHHLLKLVATSAFLLFTQNILAAPSKVQICHLPPDNPDNFHTITVSEKALPAHLAHGDLAGPCVNSGEVLCDDGNACTIDAIDPETETCLDEHPPVNCSDDLLCTIDSCDPAVGCQYAPQNCDDGDLCTVDACSEFDGQCTHSPIDCGTTGVCLSATGQCDYPCDGIVCDPVDQCHEPGICVLLGECVDGPPVVDGTPCDDGDQATADDQCLSGVCTGTPIGVSILSVDLSAPTGADGLHRLTIGGSYFYLTTVVNNTGSTISNVSIGGGVEQVLPTQTTRCPGGGAAIRVGTGPVGELPPGVSSFGMTLFVNYRDSCSGPPFEGNNYATASFGLSPSLDTHNKQVVLVY